MRLARLFGLAFAMMAAFGLTSAGAASAVEPLFKPANGQLVTGTSGTSTWQFGLMRVRCNKDTWRGAVSSSLLLGNVVIHYLECVYPLSNNCPANSQGAPAGLILTDTLHGILGLVLPAKTIGILLLPMNGRTIATLAEATNTAKEVCAEETLVTGSFAGEVESIGKSQTTNTITVALAKGEPDITDIDLTHGLGLSRPSVTGFGVNGAFEQTEAVTFAEATEVT
jgi:hypothetical protein